MADEDIEEASVATLVREVERCENYAFLIGAGTSRPPPAKIPTGSELIETWQKECYKYADSEEDMEDWAKTKENEEKGNDESRYGFWFEQYHPTRGGRKEYIKDLVADTDPNFEHVLLATMMEEGYVPHVLTPNFDDLLFDAFYLYLEDKPQVIDHRAVAPEFRLTHSDSSIVKLHGDYRYDNLRNTDSETKKDGLGDGMKDALQQTVEEYGLVVVGYSGGDDSIMDPLLEATPSEYGIYWCTRDSESFSDEKKAEELLAQPNTHLVEIEGFGSLMRKFGNRIDGVESPQPDEITERAEERADMLRDALEESKETVTDDEEEEYVDKTAKVWEGVSFAREGNYEKAVQLYTEAIEEDPDYAVAYNNRGNAKQELGEYEAAIADYDTAIELDPDYAMAYNNRGNAKKALGEYETAIDNYDTAIEVNPELAQAYYNRGLAKYESGEFEAAINDYDTAIELDPNYAIAYNSRGNGKKTLGEYEAAIDDYDTAIELDPDDAMVYSNRAETKIEMGDFEQARRDASQAKEVSESTADSATSSLFHLISGIVLGEETADEESEYRDLCEKEFTTTWNFEELDSWLRDADFESDKKDKIAELIDLLREHKEKPATTPSRKPA